MLNCYFSKPFFTILSIQAFKCSTTWAYNYHKWHRALVYAARITIQFSPRRTEKAEKKRNEQKSIFILAVAGTSVKVSRYEVKSEWKGFSKLPPPSLACCSQSCKFHAVTLMPSIQHFSLFFVAIIHRKLSDFSGAVKNSVEINKL